MKVWILKSSATDSTDENVGKDGVAKVASRSKAKASDKSASAGKKAEPTETAKPDKTDGKGKEADVVVDALAKESTGQPSE